MFKVGDKVIRTGGDFGNVCQGKTYSVLLSNDFNVWLVGIREAYAKNKFKLVEDDMKIKITKWSDLHGRKNSSYELSGGYDDVIYIHLSKTAARIHVICLEDSREMILSVLKLFGFSVSFTEPIKLTKADYYFVRYLYERFGGKMKILRREGEYDLYIYNEGKHLGTACVLEFIKETPWSIESLRELECEEEV